MIAIGALALVPALLLLTERLDRLVRRRTIRSAARGDLAPGDAARIVAEEAQAVLDAQWQGRGGGERGRR